MRMRQSHARHVAALLSMKNDTRKFHRKPIRGRTILQLADGLRLGGSAKDLSQNGIGMLLAEQVPVGVPCTAALETMHLGRLVHFAAQGKVVYSILSGTDGFRVGVQFTNVDAANSKILSELMA